MVTNNFVVHLNGDGKQGFGYQRKDGKQYNIKSVQTSVSSRDLAKEKCSDCQRQIRSQEDVRSNNDEQFQGEIWESLGETCSSESSKLLGEKMRRLAFKLSQPGGEEKIRQKIKKYLRRVPSHLSDCDEDTRQFREQLPNGIIRKLKQMYLKAEKKKNGQTSPVRILRIEIPKHDSYYDGNNKIRCSVDDWIKDVPMKKRDFLGRSIRKDDVVTSIVNQIQPYIQNRHSFDKDYRSTLRHIILEVLKDMPIETDEYDKVPYLNNLAISLICHLLNIKSDDNVEIEEANQRSDGENIKRQHYRDIEAFGANEIANVMNKLHLSISTKRLALLEEELTSTLLDVFDSKDNNIDAAKENVFIILHNLGGLSNYQANYFTDVLVKHFKQQFCDISIDKKKHNSILRPKSLTGISLKEAYSVFHNVSKIKSNITICDTRRDKTDRMNKNDDDSVYRLQLIAQIDHWLQNLDKKIPIKKGMKDKIIKNLADDIIDRHKYLELNPSSKGTDENELQYLKYQIFKWINKVAGENTMETIEHAKKLMERIQAINTLKAPTESDDELTDVLHKHLKDVHQIENKAEQIKDLATRLEKGVKNLTDVHGVIDKEVQSWAKIALKGNKTHLIDRLKKELKIFFAYKYRNIDPKQEKICVRNYEDLVDDWLDTLLIAEYGEIIRIRNKNEHIHNFAIQLYKCLNSNLSRNDQTNYLRNITFEWFETLPLPSSKGKLNVLNEHIDKLVESLMSCTRNENKSNNNQKGNSVAKMMQQEINPQIHHNANEAKYIVHKDIKISTSNIAVYGVTLTNNTDTSIKEINENDIEASLQQYSKQLVQQINEWLNSLKIQQIHDKGFKEIVVNDLAGDIIDRHKYLELNPASRGTEEHDLEQLKYQIFKWINKLVGEEEEETVQRAQELMDRIRSIPVPMLVKQSEREGNTCCPPPGNKYACKRKSVPNEGNPNVSSNRGYVSTNANMSTTNRNVSERVSSPLNVRLSSPLGFTTGPMATSTPNSSQKRPVSPDKASNGNNKKNCPVVCASQLSEESAELPPGMEIDDVYAHYDKIINERIKEIPLETPSPEQEMLAEFARKGLHNGIWKTYFQLKGDPEIENDYSYFELLFEEKIDEMLDCVPQTNEIQKIRAGWKSKLMFDIMNMLKYVHSVTDTPSFREKIADKFDRQFLRAYYQEGSNLHQHGFVVRTADAYILYSKYKEEDPIKANVYKQRLMKRIEELSEAVKSQNNIDFRYINQAQLCQIAMQLLESVPIPKDEVLKEEAEEILVGEEIETWYNALPVLPILNDTDDILRKRMRELLAKRLCEIEKKMNLDDSQVEMDAKHEISKFLHEKAALQPNEDLNIGIMVEELTNRLKSRRNQNMVGYETFEKEKPISSSFVQTDPGETLAPLVDLGSEDHRTSIPFGQGLRTSQVAGPSGQGFHTSQIAGPSSQGYYPARESVLGTSQVHPSTDLTSRRIPVNDSRRSETGGSVMPNSCRRPSLGNGVNRSMPEMKPQYQSSCQVSQDGADTNRASMSQARRPSLKSENLNGVDRNFVSEMPPCQVYQDTEKNQSRISNAPMPSFPNRSAMPPQLSQGAAEMNRSRRPSLPRNGLAPPQRQGQVDRSTTGPSHLTPSGQVFGQDYLSAPQGTGYVTGPTRSTARVGSPLTPSGDDDDDDEDGDESGEVRVRCRCMERVWKCKRHFVDDRRCYPKPFPCRFYY